MKAITISMSFNSSLLVCRTNFRDVKPCKGFSGFLSLACKDYGLFSFDDAVLCYPLQKAPWLEKESALNPTHKKHLAVSDGIIVVVRIQAYFLTKIN